MHRTADVRRVPLRTGDAVTIRGERWRVAAESPFESVSIINVDGCDATNRGTRTRFILPFERFDVVTSPLPAPRIVTRSRWRRAARATLADAVPTGRRFVPPRERISRFFPSSSNRLSP